MSLFSCSMSILVQDNQMLLIYKDAVDTWVPYLLLLIIICDGQIDKACMMLKEAGHVQLLNQADITCCEPCKRSRSLCPSGVSSQFGTLSGLSCQSQVSWAGDLGEALPSSGCVGTALRRFSSRRSTPLLHLLTCRGTRMPILQRNCVPCSAQVRAVTLHFDKIGPPREARPECTTTSQTAGKRVPLPAGRSLFSQERRGSYLQLQHLCRPQTAGAEGGALKGRHALLQARECLVDALAQAGDIAGSLGKQQPMMRLCASYFCIQLLQNHLRDRSGCKSCRAQLGKRSVIGLEDMMADQNLKVA